MRIARTHRASESGFTIAELVVTIGIISILAALAMMSTSYINKERVKSATKELYADLQKARNDAIVTGPTALTPNKLGMGIRLTSSSYTIFSFNDKNPPPNGNYAYDGTDEEAQPVFTKTLTSNVKLTDSLNGGALVAPISTQVIVIFDKFGFPRVATDNWKLINGDDVPAPVVIGLTYPGVANYTRCISIGRNRIQEGFWNGTTSTCNEQ
jgi:prepilin-type N-terminal cleavage/methylation domain-containing protein